MWLWKFIYNTWHETCSCEGRICVYIIISGELGKFGQAKLVSHRKKRGLIAAGGYNVCLQMNLGVGSQSECGIPATAASARRVA